MNGCLLAAMLSSTASVCWSGEELAFQRLQAKRLAWADPYHDCLRPLCMQSIYSFGAGGA